LSIIILLKYAFNNDIKLNERRPHDDRFCFETRGDNAQKQQKNVISGSFEPAHTLPHLLVFRLQPPDSVSGLGVMLRTLL
jgi:hypothetical protein